MATEHECESSRAVVALDVDLKAVDAFAYPALSVYGTVSVYARPFGAI